MARYVDRDTLKAALSIPTSSTAKHSVLDTVVEGISREIDAYTGYQFAPSSGVRYYQPTHSDRLDLDYPLLSVDSIALDTDGDASYESTLAATGYYTLPPNATAQSPAQPFWGLELRPDCQASAVFPAGVARGVKITGTWGWYDQRVETTAKPSTAIDSTQTWLEMSGATALHPGQMVRVDAEQMLVLANGLSGSDTATTSGRVSVRRAQGGTSGATHGTNSTCSLYEYPIVDSAARMQAEMDFRAMDAPLGIVGGDMSGGQPVRAVGGLHPFVRRQLDTLFRVPVIA